MFKHVVRWIGLSAILIFSPICGAARAQTSLVGGPGGGNFDDRCPSGAYLVGVRVIAGKDMNQITAICQAFVNGHAAGPTTSLRTWGKWSSNGSVGLITGATCAPDTAAEGMQVQVSRVALVHRIALRCRNPGAHVYSLSTYSGTVGGEAGYENSVGCGGGAISNGLVGRDGGLIDALGLSCTTLAGPVAPPVSSPGPTPPAHPPVAAGTVEIVRVPTAIYDVPNGRRVGRLTRDEAVTIVACNQPNWCLISQPQAGAVMASDLRRR